jgi:hypothetical protein
MRGPGRDDPALWGCAALELAVNQPSADWVNQLMARGLPVPHSLTGVTLKWIMTIGIVREDSLAGLKPGGMARPYYAVVSAWHD